MIVAMRRSAGSTMLLIACVVGIAGCGGSDQGQPAATAPGKQAPPAFSKTVDLSPVSGRISVSLPGASGFVALAGARQVPVGTVVDARAGVVRLTAATGASAHLDSGDFQAGTFEIRQDAAEPGLTELRIRDDPKARAACSPGSTRVFGRLLGDASGRFRTRGRQSVATVRGTQWGVRNRCDGTLTIVRRGVVVVTDLARHKRVVVRAGHSFLAKAG
jgi:hypothetical protein